jgi:hypothetical protein
MRLLACKEIRLNITKDSEWYTENELKEKSWLNWKFSFVLFWKKGIVWSGIKIKINRKSVHWFT